MTWTARPVPHQPVAPRQPAALRQTACALAPFQPPAEPRCVGVDTVQGLELLAVRGIDALQRRVEAGRQRGGDVGPFPEGRLGRLGPLAQGVVGLGQELLGRLQQPVMRQRQG